MSILEKLGLGRKKKGPIPFKSAKRKKEEQVTFLSEKKYIKPIISLLFLALVIVIYPRTSVQDIKVEIGEPWRDEDLTAQFTFSLVKEEKEIQEEVEEVEASTVPIFHVDDKANIRIQTKLDSLFRKFDPVLDKYAKWQKSIANEEEATEDSLAFVRQKEKSRVGLDDNGWEVLLKDYAAILLNEAEGQEPGSSRFVGIDIRLKLEQVISDVLRSGVINRSKEDLNLSEITVRS
ncbi:MAG: hypothetical protein WD625_11185, partial [Balneolales bacterium]